MGKTQLFIPDKCKVGLQLREGTYTGKLGYIIYHDGKVWRKETSWESWRHKVGQEYHIWNRESRENIEGVHDESVAPIEFDNTPTEGFVLNKKAGGYSSGWNHRQTYSRVYDPRGWEFEITVENLIYILQECNSYKGKGLEGEFVYSWAGKDLVLLPVSSPDYAECQKFTDLQSVKFSARDLVEGHTYLTSRMEEWVYLGRHLVYEDTYYNNTPMERDRQGKVVGKKKHVFMTHEDENGELRYEFLSSMTRIKKCIVDKPHVKFADYIDALQVSEYTSLADHLVVEPFTEEWLNHNIVGCTWLYHTNVYPFMEINSPGDLVMAKKNLKLVDGTGDYEVFRRSVNSSSYSWRDRETEISEGIFSLEELKQNYGNLVRVYKNGFKKQV